MLGKYRLLIAVALLVGCGSEDTVQPRRTSNDAGVNPPGERDALAIGDVVNRDAPDGDASTSQDASATLDASGTDDAPDNDGASPIDGSSPSPEASPVAPIERGGRYVFSAGDVTLEVDPNVGGRVTAFALAGQNLLTAPDVDPGNYGSTFWTSPQSDWGWPPIAEIDNLPYAAAIVNDTLVLTGTISQRLGVSVTKIFAFDAATRSARIEYIVHNHRSAPRMLAPWEVTRVRPNGLTFFPTGEGEYRYGATPLRTQNAAGMTWFDYDAASISADSKFFADGNRGLLFHVAADGAVFIKRFSDTPGANHAPSEGEIEIYANAAHTYIELENQGAYKAIAPGESLSYRVDWFLRKLPAGIEAKVGDPALLEFVESVVR